MTNHEQTIGQRFGLTVVINVEGETTWTRGCAKQIRASSPLLDIGVTIIIVIRIGIIRDTITVCIEGF